MAYNQAEFRLAIFKEWSRMLSGQERLAVGETVIYSGILTKTEGEFRGFHISPETGKKMARVIFRLRSQPPFEMSVDLENLSLKEE